MDFSAVCRMCLSTESLNPIFMDNDDHSKYSSAVFLATGVQVQINDNLPQNMCTGCVNFINSALKFRKQCKEIETELLRILKTELQTSTEVNIDSGITLVTLHETIAKKTTLKDLKTDFDNVIETKEEAVGDNLIKSIIESEDKEKSKDITLEIGEQSPTTDYLYETLSDDDDIESENKTIKITPLKSEQIIIETVDLKESVGNTDSLTVTYEKGIKKEEGIIELPYNVLPESKNDKNMRVMCKLCQKELSIRSVDSHMARRHPGADERKVKCELCDAFLLREKLNRHIAMIHGSGCFRCGYCKLEFKTQQMLMDHVQTCSAKNKRRKVSEASRQLTECDVCHKKMQKASLKMHKAIKHAGLRPVCEHCGKSFGNKLRLNEHYRAKHGYEKFRCTYCEFASASIVAMRNHERRHRGEKPFVCETCGAKFHAAYLLAQHKHSHRTEKNIQCDLCPATFKANNSLHMHKQTCHSTSVYACSLCRRAYSCRHYAVKHLRHVHSCGASPALLRLPRGSAGDTGGPGLASDAVGVGVDE